MARATGFLATFVVGQAIAQVSSAAALGPTPVSALADAEQKGIEEVLVYRSLAACTIEVLESSSIPQVTYRVLHREDAQRASIVGYRPVIGIQSVVLDVGFEQRGPAVLREDCQAPASSGRGLK